MSSHKNDYAALDRFNSLLARRKPIVYVGDQSDIRVCRWLVRTAVIHNFPKRGYMVFANGWVVGLNTHLIRGRNEPVYFFSGTPVLEVVWQRHTEMEQILRIAAELPEVDCVELARIVLDENTRKAASVWIPSRVWALRLLETYLPQLGLVQLKELREMVD